MATKIIGRGKTYPFREWFRKSGFEWNAAQRQWERLSSTSVEIEQFKNHAAGRFELVTEPVPSGPKAASPVRIAEPDVCTSCGCRIPAARLAAVPGTRLCVTCAVEKGQKGKRTAKEVWGPREAWKKDRGGWRKNH